MCESARPLSADARLSCIYCKREAHDVLVFLLLQYTQTVDYTDVHVVGGNNAFLNHGTTAPTAASGSQREGTPSASGSANCADALVTTRWLGFVRVWRGTGQVFDSVDLFLPDVQYATEATYIRLPAAARRGVEAAGLPFRDSVHAAAHAVLNVLPLFVMCNPNDLGAGESSGPYCATEHDCIHSHMSHTLLLHWCRV